MVFLNIYIYFLLAPTTAESTTHGITPTKVTDGQTTTPAASTTHGLTPTKVTDGQTTTPAASTTLKGKIITSVGEQVSWISGLVVCILQIFNGIVILIL